MGIRNKDRRRIKRAKRDRVPPRQVGGTGWQPRGPAQSGARGADAAQRAEQAERRSSPRQQDRVTALVLQALRAEADAVPDLDRHLRALADPGIGQEGPQLVADELESRLAELAARALLGHWQATDLWQVVRRRVGPLAAQVVVGVLPLAASRAEVGADPARLADELAGLGAPRRLDPLASGWLDVVGASVRMLGLLAHLYLLQDLGAVARARPAGSPQHAAILAKVRALLAKAESTSFDEEADALTAKATELMTRHRIDQAALDAAGGSEGGDGVAARRCWLDDPYVPAKALLLHVVAQANRCQSVRSDYGFVTIIGHPDDVEITEILFTSLLVQATRRIASLGSEGARRRQPSYRRSFLVGFSSRIGARLAEASQAATDVAAAEIGDRFLPVLARQKDAVDEAVGRLFGGLRRSQISVTDPSGYVAGVAAADLADLGVRRRLEERPTG